MASFNFDDPVVAAGDVPADIDVVGSDWKAVWRVFGEEGAWTHTLVVASMYDPPFSALPGVKDIVEAKIEELKAKSSEDNVSVLVVDSCLDEGAIDNLREIPPIFGFDVENASFCIDGKCESIAKTREFKKYLKTSGKVQDMNFEMSRSCPCGSPDCLEKKRTAELKTGKAKGGNAAVAEASGSAAGSATASSAVGTAEEEEGEGEENENDDEDRIIYEDGEDGEEGEEGDGGSGDEDDGENRVERWTARQEREEADALAASTLLSTTLQDVPYYSLGRVLASALSRNNTLVSLDCKNTELGARVITVKGIEQVVEALEGNPESHLAQLVLCDGIEGPKIDDALQLRLFKVLCRNAFRLADPRISACPIYCETEATGVDGYEDERALKMIEESLRINEPVPKRQRV